MTAPATSALRERRRAPSRTSRHDARSSPRTAQGSSTSGRGTPRRAPTTRPAVVVALGRADGRGRARRGPRRPGAATRSMCQKERTSSIAAARRGSRGPRRRSTSAPLCRTPRRRPGARPLGPPSTRDEERAEPAPAVLGMHAAEGLEDGLGVEPDDPERRHVPSRIEHEPRVALGVEPGLAAASRARCSRAVSARPKSATVVRVRDGDHLRRRSSSVAGRTV